MVRTPLFQGQQKGGPSETGSSTIILTLGLVVASFMMFLRKSIDDKQWVYVDFSFSWKKVYFQQCSAERISDKVYLYNMLLQSVVYKISCSVFVCYMIQHLDLQREQSWTHDSVKLGLTAFQLRIWLYVFQSSTPPISWSGSVCLCNVVILQCSKDLQTKSHGLVDFCCQFWREDARRNEMIDALHIQVFAIPNRYGLVTASLSTVLAMAHLRTPWGTMDSVHWRHR